MIIEPSNYTYETMPDYTDAVDGAVEIPVTGEEIEIRYAHEVVYDEAHNLHLEIFTPFQMAHRSALGRASHLFRDPPG